MNIFRIIYNFLRKEKKKYEFVPLDFCRGNPAFSFGRNGSHPHIKILREYATFKDSEKLSKNLVDFYSGPNFVSAADIYYKNIGKRKFQNIKAYAMPFPWSIDSLKLNERALEKGLKREAKLNLFFGAAEEWWPWGGTASLKKVQIEMRRYEKILLSFIQNGYDKSIYRLSPITGTLVVSRKGERIMLINSGQHRCIVASAINILKIIVRVDSVVYFQDFNKWHLVKTGVFSKFDIDLFEEIFFSSRGLDY
jgi:hypothetical protein